MFYSQHLSKVIAVKGTFQELDLITQHASEADLVVNTADSDNLDLLGAILRGIKKRCDAGKGVGSFIQTSGTAVFFDEPRGEDNPHGRVWTVSAIYAPLRFREGLIIHKDTEEDIREYSEVMPNRLHGPADLTYEPVVSLFANIAG